MKRHAIQPRKRFGQNFLMDGNIIRKIIREVRPRESDHIIEIGPGKGAITEDLFQSAADLDVIEIDRDLIELLGNRFGGNLRIHSADVLKMDIASLHRDKPLRIVGNLPYNISTPLIFKLMAQIHLIGDMHFMLQREVVDRLASVPSTPAYGRLGIMVQYQCRVEKCFEVPPTAFNPPPKVHSAVVRLVPHDILPDTAVSKTALQTLVTTAFTKRRKTLRNALKTLISSSSNSTSSRVVFSTPPWSRMA